MNISFYYAIIYLNQVTLSSHIRTMGACNRGFPSKRAIYTTTKTEKAVFITAFSILNNEVSGCKHARKRVRQQAKGAHGCAGERKPMSATGREQTQKCMRKTISLPLSLTLNPLNLQILLIVIMSVK